MVFFKKKKKNKAAVESTNETVDVSEEIKEEVKDLYEGDSYHKFLEDEIPETREEEIELRIKKQMLKEDPSANPKKRAFKKELQKRLNKQLMLRDTYLEQIKPIGNLKFEGSYMRVNGAYASIVTFVVLPGVTNGLRPMWGIDLIPKFKTNAKELNEKVNVKLMMNISRRSNKWAEGKLTDAKEVTESGARDTAQSNQAVENMRFRLRAQHTEEIAQELAQSASYLDLSIRIAIKAPTLELLEEGIASLQSYYATVFNTSVELTPFYGELDKEYRQMFNLAEDMVGENYQLTSTELAGSYPFVTRGINDPDGTYVGSLRAEVNSDPVLLNTMNFENLAIVCATGSAKDISSTRGQKYPYSATTGWGVKYTQDALCQGRKVVEFVLNQEDPRKVGMSLQSATQHYDVVSNPAVGINMLESFEPIGNEQIAFSSQINKIQLIARQFSIPQFEGDTSVLNSQDLQHMGDLLERFYISKRMWREDAKVNPEDLRFLGIDSQSVPKLSDFIPFIRGYMEELKAKIARHQASERDVEVADKIFSLFREMSDRYGYLFDKRTSISRGEIAKKSRVIYDFKSLGLNNERALMGHFVNIFEFGSRPLAANDVLIIHGAEMISPSVATYLDKRFNELFRRGVKVVLLYSNPEVLLGSKKMHEQHNQWFTKSTSKLVNNLTAQTRKRYEELLSVTLPGTVSQALTTSEEHVYFMNREDDSSLFNWDINI